MIKFSRPLIVAGAAAAVLAGMLLPGIEATPAVAPLSGAVYGGDRVATLADHVATLPAAEHPEEDEPGFDCRVHRNQQCGVLIEGTWYVVGFDGGLPVSVVTR